MDHAIDDYDPQHSNAATLALQQIRKRLEEDPKHNTLLLQESSHSPSLRIHSMKQHYSFDLLHQFYQELMLPNFPLESERDDLDDWTTILDPEQMQANDPGPDMDVLLLVRIVVEDNDNDKDDSTTTTTILAGFAVEYYKRAQTGLLTYCVVATEGRRRGILGAMHPVAICALQQLHTVHSNSGDSPSSCRPLTILAETNTIHAGDVSPDECQARHRALYRLGYRLLQFPYVQPPLQEDGRSFDDIMLLVFCGTPCTNGDDENEDSTLLYPQMEIPTEILHGYVLDFFKSVYGYHDGEDKGEGKYVHHWYYQLVSWFKEHNPTTTICPELPWNDVTDELRACWKQEQHVVIVGAGISGLVAAITLAQTTTQPLQITLIEAHAHVGGRIRTVLTHNHNHRNHHKEEDGSLPRQYVDDPKLAQACQKFAPWPISIGAEFVHGVNSVVNELIVQNNILVEETFDLCTVEDYPSDHAFTQRSLTKPLSTTKRNKGHVQVFGDGKCWNLRDTTTTSSSDSRFLPLVRKAQQLWGELVEISENFSGQEESHLTIIPEDKSLAAFVDERMASESDADNVATVKSILEAMFANTAGSSNDSYGVNEASREDSTWDYAESNYRTEGCFAELITHHLDEIDQINRCADRGEGSARIKILTNCPIVSIRDVVVQGDKASDVLKVQLTRLDRLTLLADKTIVTVPLAVLKGNKIMFEGGLTLPAEKRKAIDAVNMFSGAKAHLLLRRNVDIASHPSDLLDYTELFFCPGEIFSQVWIRRDSSTVLVTGFVAANCCDKLKDQMDGGETAKSLFLDQLQRMFSSDPSGEHIFLNETHPSCSAFAWHDWSEDEYILGMYSSPSVGAGWQPRANSGGDESTDKVKTCRDFLAKPIKDLVFFAGEHTNTKTCATVQAAMESGLRVAEEVLHSMLH
jgi:hypothetical protein